MSTSRTSFSRPLPLNVEKNGSGKEKMNGHTNGDTNGHINGHHKSQSNVSDWEATPTLSSRMRAVQLCKGWRIGKISSPARMYPRASNGGFGT